MATSIDPGLWQAVSQRAIEDRKQELAPLNVFSHDYSSEIVTPSSTVSVNIIGAPSSVSQDVTADVDYSTDTSGSISNMSVQLNTRYSTRIEMNDVQIANLTGDTLAKFVDSMANDIDAKIELGIFTDLLAASDTTAAESGTLAFTDVVTAGTWASKNKFPRAGRSLIASPEAIATLLADETVSKSFYTPTTADAIREGRVTRLAGFDVYESLSISELDALAFATTPSAVAVAARYLPDNDAAVCYPIVARNGLTYCAKLIAMPLYAKKYFVLEVLCGWKVIQSSDTDYRSLAITGTASE